MRMYRTSRETDFNKEIWYESESGSCSPMYFPWVEKFLRRFPWLAVRIFWLCIKIRGALNVFVANYPPVYPNLLCQQSNQ